MASSSSSPEPRPPPPASPESPPPHLRALVTALLESNYFATLPYFIHRFIQTPNNDKPSKKEILDFFSFNEPSSFSLKLAELLSCDPPLHIRNEAVLLLQETLAKTPTNEYLTIRCDTILDLKNLILEPFMIEIHEPLLPPLSSAIAALAYRIYDFGLGGWLELLEYTVSCVTLNSDDDDSVLKQRKGLMLLAQLPVGISEHREFWKNHYDDLYENLFDRIIDENAEENLQALVFDSMYTMLVITLPLEESSGDSILMLLVDHIDQHSNEEILLKRFQNLANFFSEDVDQFLEGNEGYMFKAMLRIAERNGTNKGLRCAIVKVLEGIVEDRFCNMEFSDVDAQRFIKVSLEMMFESDTECYKLGKSMLNLLSFKDEENLVFPMLTDFLKSTYLASKYLKKRHAVMAIVARFADENISDDSVFATEIIKMIVDEINHIISIIIECGRAQEAGTSEGGSEYLPDEEIIRSSKFLMSTTVKAFRHRLSSCAKELFSTIAQIWGNDFPDRVKAIALFFMNLIAPHFSDKLQIYHDGYTYELLKATEGSLHAQESARGIGICAIFGEQKFKIIVNEFISKLYSLIEYGQSIKGEEYRHGTNISDTAVSALGLICEFHLENVDGQSEVIRRWLSFFPLTDNLNRAKYVHGQLSRMLKRKDEVFLGPNKENLPKIISILKAILLRRDELATVETRSEITVFLNKHGRDL